MKTLRIYALANEMKLDANPTSFLIPLGAWPYGMREIELPDGTKRKVYVTQSLDRHGATQIADALNTAIARGEPGLPIYWGHPDVPGVAQNFPDKRSKGWIRSAAMDDATLLLSDIEWVEPPSGGFGWFSPYWHGPATLTDPHNATVTVNELISIGLTNQPNILDFRLANEANYNPNTQTSGTAAQPKDHTMNREQILEVLGLPPDTTDEQIIAELTKLKTAAADATTKLEAANAETAAAEDEKKKAEEGLANERQLRVNLLLDSAIAERRISVAARPVWAKRLTDDPIAGALALANEKPLKTESDTAGLKNTTTPDDSIRALVKQKEDQGLSYDDAWAAVKAERPELFK